MAELRTRRQWPWIVAAAMVLALRPAPSRAADTPPPRAPEPPSPTALAEQLPVFDAKPEHANDPCPPAPRSALLPDDATCLTTLDVDLDGDHRRDRLLIFKTPGDKMSASPSCQFGCPGGHLLPKTLYTSTHWARAVLATGAVSDISPSAEAGGGTKNKVLAFAVSELDGDGGDEVLVTDGVGEALRPTARPLSILTIADGRLSKVEGRNGTVPAGQFLTLSNEEGERTGYRCRDTNGARQLAVVGWRALGPNPLTPTSWSWSEKDYRWEAKTLVLAQQLSGVFQGDPKTDPRAKQYEGVECAGPPVSGTASSSVPPTRSTTRPPAPGGCQNPLSATQAAAVVQGQNGIDGRPWVADAKGYDSSVALSFVRGDTAVGTGDSPVQVFFFHNGCYVGPATPQASYFNLEIAQAGNDTVVVRYGHYRPGDPTAQPSLADYVVRFQWDGAKVVSLDPLPPPGQGQS